LYKVYKVYYRSFTIIMNNNFISVEKIAEISEKSDKIVECLLSTKQTDDDTTEYALITID